MADPHDFEDESWGDSIFGIVSAAVISGSLCLLLRLLPAGPPSSPAMTAALLLLAGQLALASTGLHVSMRGVDVLGLAVACVVFAGDLLAEKIGLSVAILALAIGGLGRHSSAVRLVTGGAALIVGLAGILVAVARIDLPIASLDLMHPNEAVGVLALALAALLTDTQSSSRV